MQLYDDLPPARLKRLILQLRSPEIGFLDDDQAGRLIDAMGLRHE